MEFINECNTVFIYTDLEEAIKEKASSTNHKLKDTYRLVKRNGYATVRIGHDRYYIHRLLGTLYYGDCEIIYHKDHNKLNNSRDNLEPMSKSQHANHHHKGNDFRSDEGIKASVNAMANRRRRNDITVETVSKLREQGMTVEQIAKKLACSANTVNRRLGMKDY